MLMASAQVDSFITDFSNANDRAVALDEKIMSAAANISSNYVDLVSLTARQVMGALDITVSSNSDGSIDASDVQVFMKDVGGSGYVSRVLFIAHERAELMVQSCKRGRTSIRGVSSLPVLQCVYSVWVVRAIAWVSRSTDRPIIHPSGCW